MSALVSVEPEATFSVNVADDPRDAVKRTDANAVGPAAFGTVTIPDGTAGGNVACGSWLVASC
jgi:hypothetical protein